MKTQSERNKIIMLAALGVAITLSVFLLLSHGSVKSKLEKEKIKSETLLSEKLKLDKSIQTFRSELLNLGKNNVQLEKVLEDTKKQLTSKEMEINRLMKDNATVKELRKKNSELEDLKARLNKQLSEMNTSIAELQKENDKLNTKLTSIQNQNEALALNNAILKAMVSDNNRIEALKGKNDKLTISARRTDKLLLSFDLSLDMGKDIYFKVVVPEGNEYSSKTDPSANVRISESKEKLMASLSGGSSSDINLKHVEMEYKPSKKLSKGLYKFHVYNSDDNYIGTTQLRLR